MRASFSVEDGDAWFPPVLLSLWPPIHLISLDRHPVPTVCRSAGVRGHGGWVLQTGDKIAPDPTPTQLAFLIPSPFANSVQRFKVIS